MKGLNNKKIFQSAFSHFHKRNVNKSQNVYNERLSRLLTDKRKCRFLTKNEVFGTHFVVFPFNKDKKKIPLRSRYFFIERKLGKVKFESRQKQKQTMQCFFYFRMKKQTKRHSNFV